MRFLADMGMSPNSVAFLRDLGHDAIHLMEPLSLARDLMQKGLQEMQAPFSSRCNRRIQPATSIAVNPDFAEILLELGTRTCGDGTDTWTGICRLGKNPCIGVFIRAVKFREVYAS